MFGFSCDKTMHNLSALSFLLISLSFLCGYGFGLKFSTRNCPFSWEESIIRTETEPPNYESQEPFGSNNIMDIVAKPYSCNPVRALQELSALRKRHLSLVEHQKRGEANRARTATLQRKVAQAGSAEDAFRKCVNVMTPELLKEWDEASDKSFIKKNIPVWDEDAEKKIDGITFKELEKTAEALDS